MVEDILLLKKYRCSQTILKGSKFSIKTRFVMITINGAQSQVISVLSCTFERQLFFIRAIVCSVL